LAAYKSRDDLGIGEHLDGMRFIAEDEMDREDARLRLRGRGIGGRQEDEVDVAGLHFLQRLCLGAELRARILIDRERALAQFHQLLVEHLRAGAITAALRLIVGEGKLAILCERRGRRGKSGAQNEAGQNRGQTDSGHE
jgi:hypothetical protein